MLLGFISLLLTVFQGSIVKICVPKDVVRHLLPCSLPKESSSQGGGASHAAPETPSHHRRLFAEESANTGYCAEKVITQYSCHLVASSNSMDLDINLSL